MTVLSFSSGGSFINVNGASIVCPTVSHHVGVVLPSTKEEHNTLCVILTDVVSYQKGACLFPLLMVSKQIMSFPRHVQPPHRAQLYDMTRPISPTRLQT